MPRKTLKYTRALEVLPDHPHSESSQLYQKLQDSGYYWDSNCSSWVFAPGETNDPATTLIRVRVWADKNRVNEEADLLSEVFTDAGKRLLERSEPYICRPPKANEARVYLVFE